MDGIFFPTNLCGFKSLLHIPSGRLLINHPNSTPLRLAFLFPATLAFPLDASKAALQKIKAIKRFKQRREKKMVVGEGGGRGGERNRFLYPI